MRHIDKIDTCITQRNPSDFANSFRMVAIMKHGYGDDGFLYECNFTVMVSWRTRMIYKYHFSVVPIFIHLLADMLLKFNKFNQTFQFDHIDITSIASTIDVTINLLWRHYLGVNFGTTTKHLEIYLHNVELTRKFCVLIGLVVRSAYFAL